MFSILSLPLFSCNAHDPSLTLCFGRFEAGTPAIGEVLGLGAAIDYLSCIGMEQIHEYEVNTNLGPVVCPRKSYSNDSILPPFSFCIPERAGDIPLRKPSFCSKHPDIWSGAFPDCPPCSVVLLQY
jgi:hypothetical protein